MGQPSVDMVNVHGLDIEILRQGEGDTLLYLHSHFGLWRSEPFLEALSKRYAVVAPAHPGFQRSAVNQSITTVEDLGYFYLDLMEKLDLRNVRIVGSSLGAWIALSIAIKDSSRISDMVLINAIGLHFGAPDEESVADIFSLDEAQFLSRGFVNPETGRKDYPNMSDDELLISSRNREAAARYGWSPCLYDPKLIDRLHRVKLPTHILWGEADRITATGYGRMLADRLPRATYEAIEGAGHFPHMEKPEETADRVAAVALATIG